MTIPAAYPIGLIIIVALCGKLYPKQTLIAAAVCILLIIIYPLIPDVDVSVLCR
jgi:hypothetical protein